MRISLFTTLAAVCITGANLLCFRSKAQDSVVVYSKAALQPLRYAVPSQILTDSVLHNLNAYSVADAIRYFAGVQVKDYGGIGGLKTVNVRNMGAAHTTVLYNGIPIGNIQNGQVDLGKFSLDNIHEIQLFTAGNHYDLQPASAYAGASALYLYSGNWQSLQVRHVPVRRINLSTGSFGVFNPSAYYQWQPSTHTSVYFNGEYLHSNGRYKFTNSTAIGHDTTAIRQNSDVTSFRAEGGMFRKLKNGGYWNTNLYAYQSERGLPGAIVNNNFATQQRLWDKNYFLQSTFKYPISRRYQLLIAGKAAYDYTRYEDKGIRLTEGYLTNTYKSTEFYLSLAHRLQLTHFWLLDIATDYRYTKLGSDLYDFAFPSRQYIVGAFSSRWYWKRLDIQAGLVNNFAFDRVEKGSRMPSEKLWGPSFAFSWQPFAENRLRLRSFYKENFRMPTFNDIYYTQYATLANLKLKPERAKQIGAGLTDYWENKHAVLSLVTIQSDFYYNYIRDKIMAIPSTNLFRWQMTNIDKVQTIGVATQAKLDFSWNRDWHSVLGLQYTWENATNRSPDTYGFPVPYSPKNSGSLTFQNSYKSWNINYSFLYVGSRYNTEDIRLINSYMTPWYTHDLAVRKKLYWHSLTATISVEANNLLDQQYEVILNYPMPGRNYKLSFQIQF